MLALRVHGNPVGNVGGELVPDVLWRDIKGLDELPKRLGQHRLCRAWIFERQAHQINRSMALPHTPSQSKNTSFPSDTQRLEGNRSP